MAACFALLVPVTFECGDFRVWLTELQLEWLLSQYGAEQPVNAYVF